EPVTVPVVSSGVLSAQSIDTWNGPGSAAVSVNVATTELPSGLPSVVSRVTPVAASTGGRTVAVEVTLTSVPLAGSPRFTLTVWSPRPQYRWLPVTIRLPSGAGVKVAGSTGKPSPQSMEPTYADGFNSEPESVRVATTTGPVMTFCAAVNLVPLAASRSVTLAVLVTKAGSPAALVIVTRTG